MITELNTRAERAERQQAAREYSAVWTSLWNSRQYSWLFTEETLLELVMCLRKSVYLCSNQQINSHLI